MKRAAMISIVVFAICGAGAQTLDGFQSAFTDLSDAMAGSLALNSTIGTTWSDAYIGNFPHLGVGLSLGTTFTGEGTANSIFFAMGHPVPEWAAELGIPIPALAATIKIGLPFFPADVGLKVGFIPETLGAKLSEQSGVNAEYKNVGLSARFRIIEEEGIVPELSLGLSGNYMTGSISAPVGEDTTLEYNDHNYDLDGNDIWTVTLTKPNIDLTWKTTTLDATAQISKNILLILTPYVGCGITVGTSSVTGGLSSTLTIKEGSNIRTPEELHALLTALGEEPPDFSATGFSYAANSNTPVARLYGGFSLNILLAMDLQIMYVPKTKSAGLSFNARIQL